MNKNEYKINEILETLENTISVFEDMKDSDEYQDHELSLLKSIVDDLEDMHSNYSLAEKHYQESLKD